MKRFLFAAFVLALVFPPTAAGARPSLSCANPVTLTGTQGTLSYPPYQVQQDQWSGQGSQSMKVCNEHDWTATAKQAGPPEAGVRTYPDSARTLTDWNHCDSSPTVGSLKKLNGTFGHSGPAGRASYDWAWDVFIDGGPCAAPLVELMVFTQWSGVSLPNATEHPTIAGTAYDLFHSGGYFQFRQHTQSASGTTHLKAVMKWMVTHHYLNASGRVLFAQYGCELLTSYGKNVTLGLNRFSVTVN